MTNITPTFLRQNLFEIFDKVALHGTTHELTRKGKKIKIVLDDNINKLDNLVPHDVIIGDPEDIIKIKTSLWTEPKNI